MRSKLSLSFTLPTPLGNKQLNFLVFNCSQLEWRDQIEKTRIWKYVSRVEADQHEQKKARIIFFNFFFSPKKNGQHRQVLFLQWSIENWNFPLSLLLNKIGLKIIFPHHPLRKETYLDWNIRILPSHPMEIF